MLAKLSREVAERHRLNAGGILHKLSQLTH
jgi:hypothetical protein